MGRRGRKIVVSVPTRADVMPDWYWFRGLHDAGVVDVVELILPVDYTARVRRYNALTIGLNSRNAVMEQDISKIVLYNCTVISGDLDRIRGARVWW